RRAHVRDFLDAGFHRYDDLSVRNPDAAKRNPGALAFDMRRQSLDARLTPARYASAVRESSGDCAWARTTPPPAGAASVRTGIDPTSPRARPDPKSTPSCRQPRTAR